MFKLALELSKIRSTTFSPHNVGRVDTRKSIASDSDNLSLMRPSCGWRRSAILSFDITFKRVDNRRDKLDGGVKC